MELIKQSNVTLYITVIIGTTDNHTVHRRQDAQAETSDIYFQLLMTREVLTHTPGAELEFSRFFAFKVLFNEAVNCKDYTASPMLE
jgi:hypothetical protein